MPLHCTAAAWGPAATRDTHLLVLACCSPRWQPRCLSGSAIRRHRRPTDGGVRVQLPSVVSESGNDQRIKVNWDLMIFPAAVQLAQLTDLNYYHHFMQSDFLAKWLCTESGTVAFTDKVRRTPACCMLTRAAALTVKVNMLSGWWCVAGAGVQPVRPQPGADYEQRAAGHHLRGPHPAQQVHHPRRGALTRLPYSTYSHCCRASDMAAHAHWGACKRPCWLRVTACEPETRSTHVTGPILQLHRCAEHAWLLKCLPGSPGPPCRRTLTHAAPAQVERYSDVGRANRYICYGRTQSRYILGDFGRSLVAGQGRNPPQHAQFLDAACPAGSNLDNCTSIAYSSPSPNANVMTGALMLARPPTADIVRCGSRSVRQQVPLDRPPPSPAAYGVAGSNRISQPGLRPWPALCSLKQFER